MAALISRIAMSYEADPGPARRSDPANFPRRLAGAAQLSRRRVAEDLHRQGRAEPLDFLRHQAGRASRRVAELPEKIEADDRTPEEHAIDANEREALLEATRRLPLPQRQVIILVLEGFDYAEIGRC